MNKKKSESREQYALEKQIEVLEEIYNASSCLEEWFYRDLDKRITKLKESLFIMNQK